MATRQATWLFLVIICMACSGWYFAGNPIVVKLDKLTLSTTADMMIHHLTVHQFDVQGQLAHDIYTPFMRHIPTNNTHLLNTPRIVISEQNQPKWEIHAQKATALYGGKQITFQQSVVVHQDKGKNNAESTFRTEEVTYFPKDKRAITALDVTLEQPGHQVQAKGMEAYLSEKHVKLLSQARGTYAPSHG
jgi:lipopolysaccharide export system protein LptC